MNLWKRLPDLGINSTEAPPGADVFESQSPLPDSFQDSYSEPEETDTPPGE